MRRNGVKSDRNTHVRCGKVTWIFPPDCQVFLGQGVVHMLVFELEKCAYKSQVIIQVQSSTVHLSFFMERRAPVVAWACEALLHPLPLTSSSSLSPPSSHTHTTSLPSLFCRSSTTKCCITYPSQCIWIVSHLVTLDELTIYLEVESVFVGTNVVTLLTKVILGDEHVGISTCYQSCNFFCLSGLV